MITPKGKLVIIGGTVDLGSSISEQEHVLQLNHLKFFDQGILKRIINESAKHEGSTVEVITTASNIPEQVGGEYIKAFDKLNVLKVGNLHIKNREATANKSNLDRMRKADVVIF